MKAVEVAVREAAGLSAQDIGTGLMRKAFAPDDGALTDMSAERAERARTDGPSIWETRINKFFGQGRRQ